MSFLSQYPWWLLSLAGAGVLAVLSGIVSLFFALGRRPGRMWTKEIAPVDSEDFMRPVAALLGVPARRGGEAVLLNNGDAWLDAMLADFADAQRSITFACYIWEPGRMSDAIFETLTDRARAGVQVRLLLDGFGSLRCPDDCIERLVAAGGRVAWFRPLSFGKLSRFHRRNHRRAIVIDGRIGYTGGMAVGDKWLGDASHRDEWRDTMVRVTGCIAEDLQSAFAGLWANVTGEVLTAEAFFPEDAGGDSDVRSFGVASAPGSEEHPLRILFFLTFLAARKRLWITTPYFVPDKHTRKAVASRARAGVDVRILMPNEFTDAVPIRYAAHSYYQELLDAGVRIYEYQSSMLHSKHVVVDGRCSIVGSANMDIRSKELNQENVLCILDGELAAQLETAFLADLDRSLEIRGDEWKRRGLRVRILERLSVFFAEQY
jgi:cardiolipin synthase